MTAYLLKDLNDNTKWKIEYRTHKPENGYEPIPIDPLTGTFEDPRWLQVENIADQWGALVPTVTVNQLLKSQLQAQDDQEKLNRANEKSQEGVLIEELFAYLLTFNENNVKDINDIKEFMKKVKDYFLLQYKADVKERRGLGQ